MGLGAPRARQSWPGAGSTPLGKYQFFARLGRGGQADAFLAIARGPMGFNKLVVVKRLRDNLADVPEHVSMFIDEARLAARLSHVNIVDTYEVGVEDGSYFIAMEYLEGQPLNRIRRHPQADEVFTTAMWVRIVAEALNGLAYAHDLRDYDGSPLGIVHRDMSPSNIYLTYEGEVKVLDFGVAKASSNTLQTETGVLKGKVSYMAPEQVTGRTDRRADLFAVGIVLWELLAHRRFLEGDTAVVIHRLVYEPLLRLKDFAPDVDPALDAIVTKALDKDASARWATAVEMRDALEDWLRKRGEDVTREQIGRALRTLYHDAQETAQQRVQEAMAGLLSDGAPPPLTGSNPAIPEISMGSEPSGPRLEVDGAGLRAQQNVATQPAAPHVASARSSKPWIVAAAAGTAFGMIAAYALWSHQQTRELDATGPASAAPAAPSSGEPAAETPSAAAQATETGRAASPAPSSSEPPIQPTKDATARPPGPFKPATGAAGPPAAAKPIASSQPEPEPSARPPAKAKIRIVGEEPPPKIQIVE